MAVTGVPPPVSQTLSPTIVRRLIRRLRRRRAEAQSQADQDIAFIEASKRFDKQWYLTRYPDVAAAGIDPVTHYVTDGAAEGRNPIEAFDTAYYLKNNPDVAASGINPFRHYIEHGKSEGRASRPDAKAKLALSAAETIARSGVFDKQFYFATYPGAVRPGMDPITHYLRRGAREGKNPCAWFDTGYYLQRNPDVAASGINPLVHFCRYGFHELRNPSREFDIGWYWVTHLRDDVKANPLAHYLSEGLRDGLEIRPTDELSDEDKGVLATTCAELLKEEKDHPRAFYVRLGSVLARLAQWPDAETALRMALAMEWGEAMLHARLATILAKQGRWWQAVESWMAATSLDARRADWHFHLGEAQEEMSRFSLAAEAYQRAIERKPGDAHWHYRMGYMWEKAGDTKLADAAYHQAIALDPGEDFRNFGVGVFHQERGYWPEAVEAYARELERKPDIAALHFRLGMAQDRCCRWHEAGQAYRNAIALKADTPYWHYRYGFVLERQEHFAEAAEAYAAAVTLSPKHNAYWQYRCGYVLAAAGQHEKACLAYLQTRGKQTVSGSTYAPAGFGTAESMHLDVYLNRFPSEKLLAGAIARDTTDPGTHYRLGVARERRGDWTGAVKAYSDAVARSNDHCAEWYYRLGFVLFRAGQLPEACAAFRETRVFRLAYGVNTEAYSKDREAYGNMQYRECLDVLPIQQRTILYESTHGASMGGNPYAIFEYLLDHPDYQGWTHLWAITHDAFIPTALRSRSNVIFVEHDSNLYRRSLAAASHLVNDSTFPYWFSRRPEQKYLNTWHGTPLKTLGKPIRAEEEFLSHRNIQRNLLHATHLISPNPHTSDVLMNDFDVRGICTAKLAETGYPRIDRTLNAKPERIARIREKLGLEPGKPVVLYAPTWRGIFGQTQVDINRLRDDIEKLAVLRCQWVFRGHPFSEDLLRDAGLSVAIASSEFDAADVLAVTDILVTDYSSIFFDFLPTRRPIFYYCYDLDEYTASRGLYFNIHDMPGTVCRDIDGLIHSVGRQLAAQAGTHAGRYESAVKEFCPHEDGHATARVVDFFLNDNDSHAVARYQDDRQSLLFFGGHFAPNGINSSFLNLMNALEQSDRYRLTVAVEPNRIGSERAWRKAFHRLPPVVTVLGKVGRMVRSAEQAWVAQMFRRRREFPSFVMREILRNTYRDEYRRAFGDAQVDALVNFDGYGAYWTTLFALGPNGAPTFTWLHNDFFEEFVLKHPYLKSQFEIYPDYDALVSVSPQMAAVNREKLADRFAIKPEKFKHCINVIDSVEIRRRAREQLDSDLIPWFEHATTFVTMGRMSPEKDHAKLIDAFARVYAQHPDARLVVLGEGPLHLTLKHQIKRLGLENAIYLAGQRSNPFPALQRCGCFVLSSNHEGQPMVLLEAMILDRPIVATDIDGNRGVLGDAYGHLVDNNVDSLSNGMLDFLRGKVAFRPFDEKAYCAEALREFDAVVLREV